MVPAMNEALPPEATQAARQLLEWYRSMGVDAAIGHEPIDWLARADAPPGHGFILPGSTVGVSSPAGIAGERAVAATSIAAAPAARSAPPSPFAPSRPPVAAPPPLQRAAPASAGPPRAFSAVPPDAASAAARSIAASCNSLAEISAALERFDGCPLKTTAKSTCVYRGAEKARLVIVGEAPGGDEDRVGKPFVGRAGQLLDLMLQSIGLSDADVHITNVVYWRPPGNRTPTPQETEACRPFLERQIALVGPDLVLALGGAAAKQVLGVADGIMRIRGRWHDLGIGGKQVRAMATLHPAYLLRTPAAKRLAWRDLLQVRAALDQPR